MDTDDLQNFIEAVLARELKTIDVRFQSLDARFQALDKALTLQHQEYLRRLTDVNGEIDRRTAQEKVDRQEYVQAAEFRESRNENETWRKQIEKELRAFPTIQDVQQWLAVVAAQVNNLEATSKITAEALIIAKTLSTTRGNEVAVLQTQVANLEAASRLTSEALITGKGISAKKENDISILKTQVANLELASQRTAEALITAKAVVTTKENVDERTRQLQQAGQYKIVLIASFISSVVASIIVLFISRWL